MEPYLAIKNTAIQIKSKNIIDIDGFSLRKGEVVGLIGENGAGKSTLLRVLALIEKPTKGNVLFDGKNITNAGKFRKNISLVFQDSLLFKGTVLENISYPLRIRKLNKAEKENRCHQVMKKFQIEHLAARNVNTLSGGETKRVCLARALVYEPTVLLLDEPFSDLDINIKRKLEEKLFVYLKERGIATVFVSHDFEEVARFCNRLVIMQKGKIVQSGLVDEILQKPLNNYVASFLGDSSFIESEIKSINTEITTIKVAKNEFSVAGQFPGKLANGQKVFLNLRPEDIFVSNNGAFRNSSVRNSYRAQIVNIEERQTYCRLKLQSGFPSTAIITKQSLEELNLYKGKTVVAGFKATAAKLLPKTND